jgi:hypothetical protein
MLNSPIAMAVGISGRNMSGDATSPSQNRRRFVSRDRDALTQQPATSDTEELEEVMRPLLREPFLCPEEMGERRGTYDAFFSELQRLNVGTIAQAEASRLFPQESIYDRSVQSDPVALSALMVRILQRLPSSTSDRMEEAIANGENGSEEKNAERA